MIVTETNLPGVLLIEPQAFTDNRGYFFEVYRHDHFTDRGISTQLVQDNLSHSVMNVVRGLHYQLARPQGKLVMALDGAVFDVAVDIRKGSPSFGKWIGEILSSENHRQMYIPEGFAHGFCVLGKTATVLYKCTDFYCPTEERGICWNDPSIGIDWPIVEPILSQRDEALPTLSSVPFEHLPAFPYNP